MDTLRTSAVSSAPTTTLGKAPNEEGGFFPSIPSTALPEMFQGMTKGDMGGVILSISSQKAKPEARVDMAPAAAAEGLLSPAAAPNSLGKVVSKLLGNEKSTSSPSTSTSNPTEKKHKNKSAFWTKWSTFKGWTKQVCGRGFTKPPSPPPVPAAPLVDVTPAGFAPIEPRNALPKIGPLARASIKAVAPCPASITTLPVPSASPSRQAWLARLVAPPAASSLRHCNGKEVVLLYQGARADSSSDRTQLKEANEQATMAAAAARRASLLLAFVPCPVGYNDEQWADESSMTALDFANAGKNEDALFGLNTALLSTVNSGLAAYLLVQRSIILSTLDYHAEAIVDCGSAIALDPTCTGATLQMAALMGGMSRPSDAACRYRELFKQEDQQAYNFAASCGCASCPLVPDDRELMTSLYTSMVEQAKWIATPNHYKMLGLPYDAGSAEIKLAYRRLALKFHPDKDAASSMCLLLKCMHLSTESSPESAEVMLHVKGEAGALFGMIQNAYEQLSNPDCRTYIDRLTVLESKLFELHLKGVDLEETS